MATASRLVPAPGRHDGSISVVAVFFALVIGGLSVTMVELSLASRRSQARSDGYMFALEAAETGLARAEQEIASGTDPGGDGVGTVFGWFAGARFAVTATPDPDDPERFTLVAQGWHRQVTRKLESCVLRVPGSPWDYGIFTKDGMTFGSSNASTDAYDSRLGSWESQAVNTDSAGRFALQEGSIGSNGPIRLASHSVIRGDAHAGPGFAIEQTSNTVVTGDTTSLAEELEVPATPYAEFLTASQTNDNGAWTATGGSAKYDPANMSLAVSSGTTLTLTGKTYFFSTIALSGGATLRIEDGPVKIYITDEAALSGGTIFNRTAQPINLQIYQYPYALPAGYTPKTNKASVSGGTNSAFVLHGPATDISMSGNGAISGAFVAREFWMKGGGSIHFDIALRDLLPGGKPKVHRLYWRDCLPPRR